MHRLLRLVFEVNGVVSLFRSGDKVHRHKHHSKVQELIFFQNLFLRIRDS